MPPLSIGGPRFASSPGDRRRGAPRLASTGLGQRGVGLCGRHGRDGHGGGRGPVPGVPGSPGKAGKALEWKVSHDSGVVLRTKHVDFPIFDVVWLVVNVCKCQLVKHVVVLHDFW